MPPYTHPVVKRAKDDPEPSSTMRVVLVIEAGATSNVATQTQEIDDASVVRELNTDMLLIDIPETNLSTLCDIDSIESISPDDQMEILA